MFGKKKKLLEAVRTNDVAGVERYFISRKTCFDACLDAIRHNAPQALDALLAKNGGFYFCSGNDAPYTRRLIDALHKEGTQKDIFSVLYKTNKGHSYGTVSDSAFINADTPLSCIQDCIEKYPHDFRACVGDIGLGDTDKLKFILTLTPKDGSAQQVLNDALVSTAAAGDTDKVELLLARGANPDYADGMALARAAENGRTGMVALLLERVSLADLGADIVTQLQQKGANQRIIETVRAATQEAVKKAPRQKNAAARQAEDAENYTRLDDHTLAEVQVLPDGGTLMTLFNFATGQQQIIFTDAQKNSHAPVIVSFKDIDEKLRVTLREKFDALARPQEQTAVNKNEPALASKGVAARMRKAGF